MTQRWPLTDLGNAERLVHHYGKNLLHSQALGWLMWDGRRWWHDPDSRKEPIDYAKQIARRIAKEASDLDGQDEIDALLKWAHGSESAARISSMVKLAESERAIRIGVDQFDTNPMLLNLNNGVVDLSTRQLHEHAREDLITKLAPVDYDPDATAPVWDAFLRRIIPGDQVRAFLQRAAGYSATGLATEHVLLILYGLGANGKTTFLEAIRMVLGNYAMQTPASTLLDRRTDASNDVARLRGARFVAAVETDHNRRLNEGLVKRLTGGDTVTARFLYREHFEFTPQFTLWLATNHEPTVIGTDNAIWRRLVLVPFNVTIHKHEMDGELPAKLRAEAPGILNWILDGLLEWQAQGLNPPRTIRQATRQYRDQQDQLGDFLKERCMVKRGLWVSNQDLYETFRKWSIDAGEENVMSQKMFTLVMKDRFREKRDLPNGARRWWGLALRYDQHAANTRQYPSDVSDEQLTTDGF